MSADDLVNLFLVLAPGFAALKLFAMFGTRRKRSEWEWTIWSVIVGVLIAVVAAVVPLQLAPVDATYEVVPGQRIAVAEVAERFLFAILLGVALVAVWRAITRSQYRALVLGRRRLTQSGWDFVLQTATQARRGIEVAVAGPGDTELIYFGSIGAFALEEDETEPWLYVQCVRQWSVSQNGFVPLLRTDGILLHREQIKRIRISRNDTPTGCGFDPTVAQPANTVA